MNNSDFHLKVSTYRNTGVLRENREIPQYFGADETASEASCEAAISAILCGRKRLGNTGKWQKILKNTGKCLKIRGNTGKSWEIPGNWEMLENTGKCQKILKNTGKILGNLGKSRERCHNV